MQFEEVVIEGFDIFGLSVRTALEDEMGQETAKIGGLWEDFYSNSVLSGQGDVARYGVYCNYESDYKGFYDVFAGVKGDGVPSLRALTVRGGKYLKFDFKGEMPGAVIQAWQHIWSLEDVGQIDRLYLTDFEEYIAEDEGSIFVGIKEG